MWELPGVLFEMGQIYEAYGAFEGALAVYQQIVTTLSFYTKYTEVSKRKHKPIDFIVYKCICVHVLYAQRIDLIVCTLYRALMHVRMLK